MLGLAAACGGEHAQANYVLGGNPSKVADATVDHPNQVDDCSLVDGDAVEIAHGGPSFLQILEPADVVALPLNGDRLLP